MLPTEEGVYASNGGRCICFQWRKVYMLPMEDVYASNGRRCICFQWRKVYMLPMEEDVYASNGRRCIWRIFLVQVLEDGERAFLSEWRDDGRGSAASSAAITG